MEFSSYQTPMDRSYGQPSETESSTNDVGIGVGDIGMSVPLGIAAQNAQGIAAKMKAGANAIEIQFGGVGRGNAQGAHTPGMHGKDQRTAIKELAEINEVNLTTHASFGIMGLAGQDQQGNFNKDQRRSSVDEIKRAMEFAADTALGGSVVVHTGEFQRPIAEEPWAQEDGKFIFKGHEAEEKDAVYRLVDQRTGQIVQQIRKNQTVARPVWRKYDQELGGDSWSKHKGDSYKDLNGKTVSKGDYIDYEGNIVDRESRVQAYDKDQDKFLVKEADWDSFKLEAKEQNVQLAKDAGLSLSEFKKQKPDDWVFPEEAQLKATLETNKSNAKGWALYYSDQFDRAVETLKKLRSYLYEIT